MTKLHCMEAGYYSFSTLAHDYMVERCKSLYGGGNWWLLKRIGGGFGVILHETDTLAQMRTYINSVDVDRLRG